MAHLTSLECTAALLRCTNKIQHPTDRQQQAAARNKGGAGLRACAKWCNTHGIFGQADGPIFCRTFEVHVPVKYSDSRHGFSVSWWRSPVAARATASRGRRTSRSSLLRSGSAVVLGSSGPPSCLGTPPSHPTTQPDTPNVTKKPPSPAHACTPLTRAADPRSPRCHPTRGEEASPSPRLKRALQR